MGFSHVLVPLLLASFSDLSSGNGWQTNDYQANSQKTFVPFTEKLTWFRARKYCADHGMNLASIRSLEEQKALEKVLNNKGLKREDMWLGGHDFWDTRNGGWSWRVDSYDELFTYTNWDEGEPNDLNPNQRCLQIRAANGYRWDNVECSDSQEFVCEMNPES